MFNKISNIFSKKSTDDIGGGATTSRVSMTRPMSYINTKSIIGSVYNRISIDVASNMFVHCNTKDDKYTGKIQSNLQRCLEIEPNIDQTPDSFFKDAVLSMFNEGHVCIVAVDTMLNSKIGGTDITELRTGTVVNWLPKTVIVDVYNENTGYHETVELNKSEVAIITNPFYDIVNEQYSTGSRLIRVLNRLDATEDSNSGGKIDIIVQLPYALKTPARAAEAEKRRKAIEDQLVNSQYGIAYVDGTEKVIQLNRPANNNMQERADKLTTQLFNQLGVSKTVFEGTASDKDLKIYASNTVDTIVTALTLGMTKAFISKSEYSKGKRIMAFGKLFKYATSDELATLSDRLTRNEIMTSNEFRSRLGLVPSGDKRADELINKNLKQPGEETPKPEEVVKDEV